MIVFTFPVLVPILIATGVYFGCGLFLSDVNALGVACVVGSIVSTLMEFAGTRGTIFFVPAAAWMGALCVDQAFGLTGMNVLHMDTAPGMAFMIMAVITAIFGLLSVVGIFAGKSAEKESAS